MRYGMSQRFLGFILVTLFVVPFHAWGGSAPLGTARAARGVKASLDNGSTWLEMKGSALPVFAGTEVRTIGGSATLELKDGSRIDVLPFSAVKFEQVGVAPRVLMDYGRLSFNLHPQSKIQLVTPVARLESAEPGTTSGEVFVTGGGVMGLKMAEGRLNVRPTTPGGQAMVASLEPVFLPKRPAGSGPLFASEGPGAPPAGVKAVFAPSGESVGYIAPDGNLAIHPGHTADLTQPFADKLIRLALNTIPDEEQRSDATPLFDVNGGYVGYLSGPVFYAHVAGQNNDDAAAAQPGTTTPSGKGTAGGGAGSGFSISPKFALGAGAVAAVAGAGAFAIGGSSGSSKSGASVAPVLPSMPRCATPLAPRC